MGTKIRQSNIELCRLVSILLVMVLHTTYQSLGTAVSFGVQLVEGLTIIGVNVFVMITGYFSATPKKISLLNLAFICLFWTIIKVACRMEFHQDVDWKCVFFLTRSNWFISSYIVLLFLAPVLNTFSEKTNKKTLLGGVFCLILLEVWFDWLPPMPVVRLGTQYGFSVLSFAIIYLLARAIRLYGIPQWFMKWSPIIYLACSFFVALMIHFVTVTGHSGLVEWSMAYCNPLIIISSVAFLMMFEQMKIQSRFINHLAKSTLACLLGHSAIFFLYKKQFSYLYDNYSGIEVVVYWALAIATVFIASILIDQLRLLLWKPINSWLITHTKNNNLY